MTCPALHILVGAMGVDDNGNPRLPQCAPDTTGTCRHCHNTYRRTR